MARRCGAKHICKSKCGKHHGGGAILDVTMFKNCTPLWREAYFVSQNVENTTGAEPFWKLRCSQIARRCGAKHICKSKCGKHHRGGAILEVCDVHKLHAAVARSIFVSQNVENTTGAEPFWKLRCSQIARGCGEKHICK